jgi:hypothetical protein
MIRRSQFHHLPIEHACSCTLIGAKFRVNHLITWRLAFRFVANSSGMEQLLAPEFRFLALIEGAYQLLRNLMGMSRLWVELVAMKEKEHNCGERATVASCKERRHWDPIWERFAYVR